ncbi:SGNH/GDSL hydrolase family protein [Paucibacter sediminis]|uniref:SGNH/GDSL hydrolase family protein n=1 Tax=Paucibacter sediminis TaxID=3019553 RepID=A0AA95NE00_9BURK|nr:SGNH/GDSL hydrolase family protein [Paucibacter sp. S2-9]WIT12414.1 SGNH/GDSL hydrolase family protein [Paucibacter sp. S2-9]
MKLLLAKIALAPLLLWQGLQVRRKALRLPEAVGPRSGMAGGGALQLRLLIVGDSSGAGVGAATQAEALAGQLSAALAQRLGGSVHWQLIAKTGHTTADALAEFEASATQAADVLVTALGVNDVVSQVSPRRWAHQLRLLHELAVQRAGVRYSLHSAVPPMHAFPLLPQPLRWLLGAHALRMNRMLARSLLGDARRGLQALPPHLHGAAAAELMAPDGFHPGPAGYQLWADALAERIVREWSQITFSSR